MSNRRRRRGENFYNGLTAVPASVDTGYEVYRNNARLFLPAGVNYVTNPKLVDGNADGMADGLVEFGAMPGAMTYTCVGGVQRIRYTAGAGVTNALVNIGFLLTIPVGTGMATGSALIWGSASGGAEARLMVTSVPSYTYTWDAPIVLSAVPARYATTLTGVAGDNQARLSMRFDNVNTGDSFDISFSQPQLELSAFPTPYFDAIQTHLQSAFCLPSARNGK